MNSIFEQKQHETRNEMGKTKKKKNAVKTEITVVKVREQCFTTTVTSQEHLDTSHLKITRDCL